MFGNFHIDPSKLRIPIDPDETTTLIVQAYQRAEITETEMRSFLRCRSHIRSLPQTPHAWDDR